MIDYDFGWLFVAFLLWIIAIFLHFDSKSRLKIYQEEKKLIDNLKSENPEKPFELRENVNLHVYKNKAKMFNIIKWIFLILGFVFLLRPFM